MNDASYNCPNCDFVEQFKWCMLIKVFIGDHTNSVSIKLFDEEIKSVLDISIDDLGGYSEIGDFNTIKNILSSKLLYTNFIFELKSTIHEFYGNESLEIIATKISDLNLINYGKMLLKQIRY